MNKFVRLPDSELEVMLIIWSRNEKISTSEILQILNGQKKANLQMVQSTLNRLLSKEFVTVEKVGRLNYYFSLVNGEDYRKGEATSFLERLYDNSPTKLFTALLDNHSLNGEDIDELKKLLEESEGRKDVNPDF